MISIPSRAEMLDILAGTVPRCIRDQMSRRRPRDIPGGVGIKGLVTVRTLNPDGSILSDWKTFNNGATNQGLNAALEALFRGGTQTTSWFCGLISQTGFTTGLNIGDTSNNHSGWQEEQGYTAGTRPAWSPGAASSGQVTIASPISLTAGGSAINVMGIFASSVAAKGASTGVLWATAVEASARAIASSGTYQFFYSVVFTPTN